MSDETPEGDERVWVREGPEWTTERPRNVSGGLAATRCRWMEHRQSCGRPAVAWFNRGGWTSRGPRARWWAYCEDHLFGRRISGGQVECWVLRDREAVS